MVDVESLSNLVCSMETNIVPNDNINGMMCRPRILLLAVQEDVSQLCQEDEEAFGVV